MVAQKWCKEEKLVEALEVTYEGSGVFHKLINTCVENFTCEKYSFSNSALGLLWWNSRPLGFARFCLNDRVVL
jgi:hypothetical protein